MLFVILIECQHEGNIIIHNKLLYVIKPIPEPPVRFVGLRKWAITVAMGWEQVLQRFWLMLLELFLVTGGTRWQQIFKILTEQVDMTVSIASLR